jgi:hypothetical protein
MASCKHKILIRTSLFLVSFLGLPFCQTAHQKSDGVSSAGQESQVSALAARDGDVEPFDLATISDARTALMATRKNLTVREPYLPLLKKGEMIKSPGEDFILRFQNNGSLVILHRGNGYYDKVIWRIQFRESNGKPSANILFLNQDAELVAFSGRMGIRADNNGTRLLVDDPAKTRIWSSQSGHLSTSRLWSCHGSALTLSDEGELLITCGRFFDGDITPYIQWSNQRGLFTSQVHSVVPSSVTALYQFQVRSIID